MLGRLHSCALAAVIGGAYAATAAASDCNELLRLGVRNTFYYQNAVDAQSVLVDKVCNAWTQSRTSGGGGKVGVDIFGIVGINLGGGGQVTEQQADNYCATHQADRRLSTQELSDLNVLSSEALQAWNHCLDNAKHDLVVDITDVPNTGTVAIALRYQGSGSIHVKGVTVSSPAAPLPTCTHQVAGAFNHTRVESAGPATNFQLKSGTTETIICTHDVSALPNPPQNVRNATVTIATDLDPIVVPLSDPQFTAVSRSELTTLVQTVTDLKKRIEALETSETRDQAGYTYILSGDNCPAGWTRIAQLGVIMRTEQLANSPFAVGAGYNGGWTWTHPMLCKAQ